MTLRTPTDHRLRDRTPARTPLLLALLAAVALATAGCGDSGEAADPGSPDQTPVPATPTAPPPTVSPGDVDLEDCELVAGPIVIEGTLGRVTGGIAGIDETTLVASTCRAGPIPVRAATGTASRSSSRRPTARTAPTR